MNIPNMSDVLNGWVTTTPVRRVTKVTVDSETVEKTEDQEYLANFQPMSAHRIQLMSPEYRSRKLWTVIVQDKEI